MQRISPGGRRLWMVLLALLLLSLLFSSVAGGQELEGAVGQRGASALDNPRQESPGAAIRRLQQAGGPGTEVSVNRATGVASFVRVPPGRALGLARRDSAPAQSAAFFDEYGRAFGIRDPGSELLLLASGIDSLGMKHLTYRQVYQGVDVFAGLLRVHLDGGNDVTAVNGVFVPEVAVDTTPTLAAAAAADIAIAAVAAAPLENQITGGPLTSAPADLRVAASKLYVYRDGLLQGIAGPDHLVYEVEVTGDTLREFVYVNAHSGKIVNRISGVESDLYRYLYDGATGALVWEEGDPFPGTLDQDQQNVVTFSGDSYYFFSNAFGWDSFNNAGAPMIGVTYPTAGFCPNAFWNGAYTNYCYGVTADDVVGHEWGHAYTQYNSGLIYQWQAGALSESYSDIWGEVVDTLNGAGTDDPGTVRTAGVCSAFTTPLVTLTVNSPAEIAGDYAAAGAAFGPTLDQTGVTAGVVLADDGAGTTTDACEPLVNAGTIAGNVALVDRGACTFVTKVKNAQNAGATGVIVANNVTGAPFTMGGSDPSITIPSIMVSLATGNVLKGELPGVNATMHLAGGATEESYRWLVGEDATAFGGAIRDMWAPTCAQDPGKVSDDEYHCTTDDGGGVHTNSGVPNHAFSLLVDGGTYNGQTVTGIGLVKASHIFWRAQDTYLGPASDFVQLADALESSCSDLLGQELEGLSTSSIPAGPSGESITAADCAEVSQAIAAVELRLDPAAQCGFEPLLAQDAPALCADTDSEPVSIHLETFEGGLDAWTLTNQGVFAGWPAYDWTLAGSLPGGRDGAAAFGIDPLAGDCGGGAGDVSGVMRMESEVITVAGDGTNAPRLAFDHYVATELGWDGGNLKISVNGGPFILVPPSAFTFNDYNAALNPAAAGNTNPLAGQPAFTGTDGGELSGSWGQSQIDLTRLGIVPGDTVQFRYDMGIDGCSGNDGWYVDDVNVYSCQVTAPDCSEAYASPATLWPPNHKFQAIDVLGVTDPHGDPVEIIIRSIFQDEMVDAPDSGNTSPDAIGIGTSTAQLRAERVESGNGRVYYIEFMARNTQGGTCTNTVEVGVPASIDAPALGDGPLYDSTQP